MCGSALDFPQSVTTLEVTGGFRSTAKRRSLVDTLGSVVKPLLILYKVRKGTPDSFASCRCCFIDKPCKALNRRLAVVIGTIIPLSGNTYNQKMGIPQFFDVVENSDMTTQDYRRRNLAQALTDKKVSKAEFSRMAT